MPCLQYQDVILDKIVGGALTFVSDKNLASILASVLLKYVTNRYTACEVCTNDIYQLLGHFLQFSNLTRKYGRKD